MEIIYNKAKLVKECSDLKKATAAYGKNVAEKLITTIKYIENAKNLTDIANYPPFRLHMLEGDRKNQFAIDLGKKLGFRLILKPLDSLNQEFKDFSNLSLVYETTTVVLILEVSNHYG